MRELQSGYYDPTPNLAMRYLGNSCYGNDTDFRWYTYGPDGRTKTLALFEWKHPGHQQTYVGYKNKSLCAQCDLADDLRVPFFIGLTFTKDESTPESRDCTKPVLAAAPMFYVVAGNKPAADALACFTDGWFAPSDMVRLHQLLTHRPMNDAQAQTHRDLAGLANVNVDYQSLNTYSNTWRATANVACL